MKSISMIRTLAAVILFLFTASVGWAADQNLPYYRPQSAFVTSVATCQQKIEALNKAEAEYIADCAAAGKGEDRKSCVEKLSDCTAEEDDEQSFDPSSFMTMMGLPGVPGAAATKSGCPSQTYSDYKSELKDLSTAKRDAEKELRELQKEQDSDEKDYSKDKNKLQQDFVEDQKKHDEEVQDAAEKERNLVAQQKESQDKLQKQLRDLQTKILTIQNSKAMLTANRATQVEDYKMQILECQSKTQELRKKLASNTAGSLAGASSQNTVKAFAENCVNKVLKTRAAQSEAYQAKMAEYDNELNNANQEMMETQQSIQLLAQQAAQAAQDRVMKTQKDAQSFQQKQMQTYQQMVEMDQQMTQKRQKLAMALANAQQAVTKASNDLDQQKASSPAKGSTKTVKDVRKSEKLSDAAKASCEAACGSITVNDENQDGISIAEKNAKITSLKSQCVTLEGRKRGSTNSRSSSSSSSSSSGTK